MKKILIIYFIGCILAWIMGFDFVSQINVERNRKTTYGHIVFVSALSCFSWISVIAYGIVEVGESGSLNKPIN